MSTLLRLQEIGQNQHEKGGWAYNTSWEYNTYSTVHAIPGPITVVTAEWSHAWQHNIWNLGLKTMLRCTVCLDLSEGISTIILPSRSLETWHHQKDY